MKKLVSLSLSILITAGLLKVWDYVNGLKTGDVITVEVLRAGEIVELKTSLPAR